MSDTATAPAATPPAGGTPTPPIPAPTTTPAPAKPQDGSDGGQVLYTKEQFDGAIGARLERERAKLANDHAAELQKAKDDAKAEAQLEVRFDRVNDKAESIAKDLKFHDTKDALATIDKDKLPLDKDGKPDEAEIKKALEDLLKAKPYLAAVDNGRPAPRERPKPATGRPAESGGEGGPLEKGRAAAALRSWAASGRK
jgi:hypothetical protein